MCQQARFVHQFVHQLRNLLVMERTLIILHLIILPKIRNHLNVKTPTLGMCRPTPVGYIYINSVID